METTRPTVTDFDLPLEDRRECIQCKKLDFWYNGSLCQDCDTFNSKRTCVECNKLDDNLTNKLCSGCRKEIANRKCVICKERLIFSRYNNLCYFCRR